MKKQKYWKSVEASLEAAGMAVAINAHVAAAPKGAGKGASTASAPAKHASSDIRTWKMGVRKAPVAGCQRMSHSAIP